METSCQVVSRREFGDAHHIESYERVVWCSVVEDWNNSRNDNLVVIIGCHDCSEEERWLAAKAAEKKKFWLDHRL